MRALCGAIITAAALIGLGLTAIGFGQRYGQNTPALTADGQPVILQLAQLDRPFALILVFLVCMVIVGLGVTFMGLAYHHHRREREYSLHKARLNPGMKV